MISIKNLLGVIGSILTILSYFIPLPELYVMYKNKGDEVKKFPYLIFIAQVLSCTFWVLYGFQIDLLALKLSESIGLITNLIFIFVYVQCLEISHFRKQLISLWIVIIYMTLIFLAFDIGIIIKLYGPIANTLSILCIFSTIQNIKQVFELKDNSYIAINIVVVYFINFIDWLFYAFMLNDVNLIVSSFIGVLVCGFQIYVYFLFQKKTEIGGDNSVNERLSIGFK